MKKENIINKRIDKISLENKKRISIKLSKFNMSLSILNLIIVLISIYLYQKEISNQQCYQSYMSGEIYKCEMDNK